MKAEVYKMRLKAGDTVIVRSGKFKGKVGKVLATHPRANKVTVEGINVVKRHRKPTPSRPQAGETEITKPLGVSKVGLFDSPGKKASRVGFKVDAKGQKVRVYKTSGKEVK